jgi:hypothetical protein
VAALEEPRSLPIPSGVTAYHPVARDAASGLPLHPASIILRPGTASFFQVAGCNQWGLIACATANRSVRTATMTYENTEDRVCLWGDTVRDYP